MKLDKKAIKDLAIRNLQYDTHNPFEATLMALETWMSENDITMVTNKDIYDAVTKYLELLEELPDHDSEGGSEES